jgi:hypothetical protein
MMSKEWCMGFYEQWYLHSAVAISWKVKIYYILLNIENNIWCITLTSLFTLYNISGEKLFIHVGQSKF